MIRVTAFMTVVMMCSTGCSNGDSMPQITLLNAVEVLAPEQTFYAVRMVLPGDSGIWVLTRDEPFLHYRHPDGTVTSFGSEGAGPDELSAPLALVDAGERVSVWDPGNAKIATFTSDARLVSQSPVRSNVIGFSRTDLPRTSYGDPFRIRAHLQSYVAAVYPQGLLSTRDFRSGRLWILGETLQKREKVVDFDSGWAGGAAESRMQRVLVQIPLWDLCPGGRLVVWAPDVSELRFLSLSGDLRRTVPVPWQPHSLTDQDIGRFLRNMAASERGHSAASSDEVASRIQQTITRERDLFPEYAPLFVNLHCSDRGDAWLQMFGTEADPRGYGRDWVRVRVDQQAELRRFRFPSNTQPIGFRNGGAIALTRDSVGLQRLVRVPIPPAAH